MFVLSAGALAGVLIWSKLRLVTDIPRSAYAEPETGPGGEDPEKNGEDAVVTSEQIAPASGGGSAPLSGSMPAQGASEIDPSPDSVGQVDGPWPAQPD